MRGGGDHGTTGDFHGRVPTAPLLLLRRGLLDRKRRRVGYQDGEEGVPQARAWESWQKHCVQRRRIYARSQYLFQQERDAAPLTTERSQGIHLPPMRLIALGDGATLGTLLVSAAGRPDTQW